MMKKWPCRSVKSKCFLFLFFLNHWDQTSSYFSRTGDTDVCWDTFILKDTGWSPDWGGGGISCCSLDCVGPFGRGLKTDSRSEESGVAGHRRIWLSPWGLMTDRPEESRQRCAIFPPPPPPPPPPLFRVNSWIVYFNTPGDSIPFQKRSRCAVTSNYDQVATGSGQYRQVSKSHRPLGCSIRQTWRTRDCSAA